MAFLYHDLYSIFLIAIICFLSILSIIGKNQIKHLISIPFDQQKNYETLYFERNVNFSFVRFLYFLIIILITTCFITLLFPHTKPIDFIILFFKLFCVFIIKYFGIITFGLIQNKYKMFQKISIINIDIKALVALYFFPMLIFISYANFLNTTILSVVGFIFIFFLVIIKLLFLYKSKSLLKYSFLDIILYICIFELSPIVLFYNLIS